MASRHCGGLCISIRGSKEATILLDGMRLPLTRSLGVVRIDPCAYDRGPSSIIAGANDPGRVLNLVSRTH